MERERAAVTCDGRLFHRRAAATGNALSPTVDRCIWIIFRAVLALRIWRIVVQLCVSLKHWIRWRRDKRQLKQHRHAMTRICSPTFIRRTVTRSKVKVRVKVRDRGNVTSWRSTTDDLHSWYQPVMATMVARIVLRLIQRFGLVASRLQLIRASGPCHRHQQLFHTVENYRGWVVNYVFLSHDACR